MEKRLKTNIKKKNKKSGKKKEIKSFFKKRLSVFKSFFVKIFSKNFNFDVFDILIIIVASCSMAALVTGFVIRYRLEEKIKFNSVVTGDALDEFISVYNEVVNKYYEEVDKEELVDAAIDGMVEHLEDKYSIYVSNDDNSLSNELDSTYQGIGIVTIENVVYDVYKESSAYREGIKAGDIIVSVNGTPINKDNYQELSELLKENDGTNVLGVLRGNEELSFKVSIETITIPTVSAEVKDYVGKKIGYVDIDSFSKNTFEEFQNEMIKLEKEKINGLIIDLRNNNGGYIDSAVNIANVLLKEKSKIYTLVTKDKEEDIFDDTENCKEYKVVVLVNKSTASSAEILASALKDSYGASLVGNLTYGKGKVQTVKYYENTALKYTSAMWLRANGESVDGVGIEPDFVVDNVIKNNVLEDKQFDKALQLFK